MGNNRNEYLTTGETRNATLGQGKRIKISQGAAPKSADFPDRLFSKSFDMRTMRSFEKRDARRGRICYAGSLVRQRPLSPAFGKPRKVQDGLAILSLAA